MSATRCHLRVLLILHVFLLSLILLSFAYPHYELSVRSMQNCSLYVTSLSFASSDFSPAIEVFAPFASFQAAACAQESKLCAEFCSVADRVRVAGAMYTLLAAAAIALLLTCLLHLVYMNCMRPIAYSRAYIVHVLAATSYCLAGSLHLVVSGGLQLPGVKVASGAGCCWAAMVLAAIGASYYVSLNKRGMLGLTRVKSSELEGTHIEPQVRPSSEEVQLEITEPSGDEKRHLKSRKELEDLRERLDTEINARKSLLADNQMLARQVEEREKSVRDLEQRLVRSQNNVQVTAALNLAKQKEEEIGKLLNRIHDLDEKLIRGNSTTEELRERLGDCERNNGDLMAEVATLREAARESLQDKSAGSEETVALREQLLAAQERLKDKEREAQMIVRSAKERESEEVRRLSTEVQSLRREVAAMQSAGSEQTSEREKQVAELKQTRDALAVKETEVSSLTAKVVDLVKTGAESAAKLMALLTENEDLKKSNEELTARLQS